MFQKFDKNVDIDGYLISACIQITFTYKTIRELYLIHKTSQIRTRGIYLMIKYNIIVVSLKNRIDEYDETHKSRIVTDNITKLSCGVNNM